MCVCVCVCVRARMEMCACLIMSWNLNVFDGEVGWGAEGVSERERREDGDGKRSLRRECEKERMFGVSD